MNREQAKKAILAVDKDAMEWVDLDDLDTAIQEAEEGMDDPDTGADGATCRKILDILRQHRDYLRTEDAALAVWREVFVARIIRVEHGGQVAGAAGVADEAETRFRRRLADHLKAKG